MAPNVEIAHVDGPVAEPGTRWFACRLVGLVAVVVVLAVVWVGNH